jgi:glycosyltransferase involved in cell wall biosynthesis
MSAELGRPAVRGGREHEILFVIASLRIGGAERHLADVAPALMRHGWGISVYALVEGGPLEQALQQDGVRILRPPVPSPEQAWSKLRRMHRLARASAHLLGVMRERRPAIVHFFSPSAYLIGAPLALLTRVPVRIMSRFSLNLYQSGDWRYRLLEPKLHRAMSAITGNAQIVVREIRDRENAPADRLAVIYSGIEPERFAGNGTRSDLRRRLGLSPVTLVMGIIANLIPYKGHADLFQALALAARSLPAGWRLLVVGRDDGIGGELQLLANNLGLAENIAFLGPRNDIPDILNACDIGILCSHQEGFSIALVEAMAAGLPMIVTDAGGNKEAVLDEETGLVVELRNPSPLADAIVRLANDASLRAKFGAAARERLIRHFTLERSVELYDALYRTLLEGGRPDGLAELRVN